MILEKICIKEVLLFNKIIYCEDKNRISKFMDYLFGIQYYLLELAGLCKALNDFVGDVGSEVHTKSQCWV